MFLSVDVGNSQTTLGLLSDTGELIRGWRMVSAATDTSDMLHMTLYTYFQKDGYDLADLTAAGISCVVPVLTRAWTVCLSRLLGEEPLIVSASADYGMPVAVPYPDRVGADRIANAIAARTRYSLPAIVVDFGTATNIDVIDAQGCYRGGTISPGLMMSADALFSKAAKLASVPIAAPAHTLATTTEEAVQAGLVVGAAAMAEGLVKRIAQELGGNTPITVIATGGLAGTVSQATEVFDYLDPDLTLRGIFEIYQIVTAQKH